MQSSAYTLAHFGWLEGIGSTSLDQVGGYTANLIGGPTWSSDGPFPDAHSVVLDGATQLITVPGLLANAPREFTVALRYKPSVVLPDDDDRRLWSIRTRDSPEETLDVLWRRETDNGGYLWIRGMRNGVPIAADVTVASLKVTPGRWASLVVSAGVAGLEVYHNGVRVGSRANFPWPALASGTDHAFSVGGFSGSPSGYLPAAVGEVLVEERMWTKYEAWSWHVRNSRHETEHGNWSKYPRNPILSPTDPWEQDVLQEPNLLYEAGIYKLWYTGGYDPEYIGYATSVDGLSWTKCPLNPVLGRGNGGENGTAARGFVVKINGTYHLFFNSWESGGDEKLATSNDGIHWTSQGIIIRATAWPWRGQFGNTSVWTEGNTWYMLFEALYQGGVWEMGAATSRDGRVWRLLTQEPLRSLQIAKGGSYGGPMVIKQRGRYYCWYHATSGPGFKPTAIYRATSLNLIDWKLYSRIPIVPLTQSYEVDQVADPTVLEVDGRCIVIMDQMNDACRRSRLGLGSFHGSLGRLVTRSIAADGGVPAPAQLEGILR